MRMKLLIICSVLLVGCDGIMDTNTFNLIQPDHEYEIDTFMENSEVYEFTPRSNTDYTCVMLMLDNASAVGLQCFPKPGSPN